ncbi:hypothetical protein V8G54_010831 [Vigna mungo]|uniref:Uncharacterized protein n=1 Tax=Vigna mungo TaxID=3915 RepID=A0AAQ3NXE4_VIGMU
MRQKIQLGPRCLPTCCMTLMLQHLKETKVKHIFQLCHKRSNLGGVKCNPIVIKTIYLEGIRKRCYSRTFVSNNHELDKVFNSLRNLIHGIIRGLLKLLVLVLKNQGNFTVH